MQKPNPYEHSCWLARPSYGGYMADHVTGAKALEGEDTCPAHAYERGVEYGKAHSCDHHRAFSLELGKPLLCPECGKEVQEPPRGCRWRLRSEAWRECGADQRIPTVREAATLARDVLLFAREECTAWRPYVQEALDTLIAALDKQSLREVREARLQGEAAGAPRDGVQHQEAPRG